MGTEAQAKPLTLVSDIPDETIVLALPLSAVVRALETSPALIDAVVARVAAKLEAREEAASQKLPERMTAAQASSYLNCSIRHIYDLTYSGQLIAIKAGKSRKSRSLYERAELDRYLNLFDYERSKARRERYEHELAELPLAR
jgi:excisionase family DNA binding protein